MARTWTRPAGRAPFEGFALDFGSFNVNVLEGPAEAAEQHTGDGGSVTGTDRIYIYEANGSWDQVEMDRWSSRPWVK